jgi:hypothetical protein
MQALQPNHPIALEGSLFQQPPSLPTQPKKTPSMRLTARDGHILEAIHAFDGVLSDEQIKRLFFTGSSQMQLRMRLLYTYGYVSRPDRRRRASIPTMVFWLTEQGAAYVAGLTGTPVNEFAYRKEPKWMQLTHDLAVNDVRLSFIQACQTSPDITLEEWIPQAEFWAYPDRVEYTLPDGKTGRRFIRPDGYAVVRRGEYVSRLLLELDRATEHNPRFGLEKVIPGIAYIRSKGYKIRFGFNSGKWLVVTTGEKRLQNMKRVTERVAGSNAGLFYFTTYKEITDQTILTNPIWYKAGEDGKTALFP